MRRVRWKDKVIKLQLDHTNPSPVAAGQRHSSRLVVKHYLATSYNFKRRLLCKRSYRIAILKKSAKCLDDKRLGKQRVEAWQILKGDFQNHPASKMWRGCQAALITYIDAITSEWVSRGFDDNVWAKVIEYCSVNTITKDLIGSVT